MIQKVNNFFASSKGDNRKIPKKSPSRFKPLQI